MTNYLDTLNPQQREAVEHTDGPLLILAGAGSGKTRVLTCRVAYLIGEKHVQPWHIMAITFTNKAAGEMRERVNNLVGVGAESVWVSTFHSSCCRMLRRYIDRIGYNNNFVIYDSDDQKQVMKAVLRSLELDPKVYKEKAMLASISHLKDQLIGPEKYEQDASTFSDRRLAQIYAAYQARLRQNNALDFDDLLVKTVELLEKEPEVLSYYQDRFQYIMIDEYQDTNTAQFRFVSLLASKYKNLCVVGDDDQSIYKFRGANILNILNFEQAFPGAKVIKLEQNYRSTQNILDAANAVIAHNEGRKEKKLWTENGQGEKIRLRIFNSGYEEAEFVANDIAAKVRKEGGHYSDYAILYRTNAMSRLFEEKMVVENIPYRLVGGVNFYGRREIKDLLAYLKTVDNGRDDISAMRIINIPKRGIGDTTIRRVQQHAANESKSFYEALLDVDNIPGVTSRAAKKIHEFTDMIGKYRGALKEGISVRELLNMILEDTGYKMDLEAEDTDEAKARLENIGELESKVEDYIEKTKEPSLSDFLQQVSLVADIDNVDADSDCVLLMTLHSAKGLEFDHVYIAGMEEGTFPSYMAVNGEDPTELEEERRLCYVGITRARKELTLTASLTRRVRGELEPRTVSRFVREIPREYVELDRETTDERNFMEGRQDDDRDSLLDEDVSFRVLSGGSHRTVGHQTWVRKGKDSFYLGDADEENSFGNGWKNGGSTFEEDWSSGDSGQRSFGSGYGSAGYVNPSQRRGKTAKKFDAKEFRIKKSDHLDYKVGDRVRHVKFGVGEVKAIEDRDKDYLVTVNFDKFGTKRMFASFAKLQKQ